MSEIYDLMQPLIIAFKTLKMFRSCDLNPLDYAVWTKMEGIVYKDIKRYPSIEELSAAVQRAWDSISQRFINKSIDEWRLRMEKIIEMDGGHIEHLLPLLT